MWLGLFYVSVCVLAWYLFVRFIEWVTIRDVGFAKAVLILLAALAIFLIILTGGLMLTAAPVPRARPEPVPIRIEAGRWNLKWSNSEYEVWLYNVDEYVCKSKWAEWRGSWAWDEKKRELTIDERSVSYDGWSGWQNKYTIKIDAQGKGRTPGGTDVVWSKLPSN